VFVHVDDGPLMATAATVETVIVDDAVDEHEPNETVRFNPIVAVLAGANVIEFVPAPAVIVPLLIAQFYVAPACTGAVAVPVPPLQTEIGPTMAANGV
jgi:hypothetical protein